MKKYFIGVLALVLAVGFSSFTNFTKANVDDELVFKYRTSLSFTNVGLMEDEDNWDYEGTVDEVGLCDGSGAAKGCRIAVTAAQLNIDSTPETTQTLADVSSDLAIDANIPNGGTYSKVLTVTRTSYSGTVSNQIPL